MIVFRSRHQAARHTAIVLAAIVAPLVVPTKAAAQSTVPAVVQGEVGRAMDQLVSRAVPFGFSGQVLVEMAGEVVLHRAYGWADPATGRPMTTETAVGVASISKSFAAAAILALEEAGRLATGDSLGRFFTDAPPDKRGITIHQLLTHTAGVTTPVQDDFEAGSLDELVASILAAPLRFEPGTDWSYSAAGYNLLAAIIEIAAGRPYGDYLRETLFGPAGMSRTQLVHEAAPGDDAARARVGWDDRGAPHEWPRNWRNFGAGDAVSTAADLLRWDRALRAGTVLSAESVARMTSIQVPINDETAYGYAFFLHGEPGRRMVEHGGDAALGYNASYYRYADEGFTVLITSATRTADGHYTRHVFGRPLESLARGEEVATAPSASAPDPMARPATFHGPGGARIHLLTDGALAWLAADGQAAVDALAGPDPEDAADARTANDRTEALIAGLSRQDSTAYAVALGEDGAPHIENYRAEWRGLIAGRGPLHSFRILGTTFGGPAAITYVRLRFRSGDATMTFFWRDRARGRLAGTFVESTAFRPPYAIPLAAVPGGGWLAHDLWSERTIRVAINGAWLVLEGVAERWIEEPAGAGWTPSFRP